MYTYVCIEFSIIVLVFIKFIKILYLIKIELKINYKYMKKATSTNIHELVIKIMFFACTLI